jgi:predicted permease
MILGEWGRRVWYVLNRARFERELAEEMAAHREMLGGEPQRFGNALRIREEAREAWFARGLDEAWQDLRHAARTLVRAPGFTITVVLILGFGIGLNLAFFQVLNVMALRPPDVKSPETLVRFDRRGRNFQSNGVPYAATQFIREHSSVLAAVLTSTGGNVVFDEDETSRLSALYVSANWFHELGHGPALGRVFVESLDERADAPAIVVISHPVWQTRFHGARDIVGRTMRINDQLATIIGVAKADFPDLEHQEPRVWLLINQIDRFNEGSTFKDDWGAHNTQLYGRLRPGISAAAAREGLRPTIEELARMRPVEFQRDEILEPYLGADGFRGPRDVKELALVALLIGSLTFVVLVVACANIGNLVLSHAIGRLRELGVRAALGASRGRILRQQIVESLVLAALGTMAGLVLAYWCLRAVAVEMSFPRYLSLAPDLRTFTAAAVIALVATVMFGIVPAWMVSRRDLIGVMKEGGYSTSRGLARARFRLLLTVAQVGGCCVLLIVAGLMVRGLRSLLAADLGFEYRHVAVMDGVPPVQGAAARAYWDEVKRAIAARPDVELVALASQAPLGESESESHYNAAPGLAVTTSSVEPAFFELMRIPLIAGRNFRPDDDAGGVVIISRRLALAMYGSLDVLGEGFPRSASARRTIVGISKDAPLLKPGAMTVAEQYTPIGLDDYAGALLLARSRGNPVSLAAPMRAAARAADGRVIASTWLMRTSYEERVRSRSFASAVAAITGMLALVLACFGIFGVVSYGVAMRTKEIGIRRALGATGTSVMTMVMRQLALPVGIGILLGTGGGIGAGWFLAREPFYLPASDGLTPVLIVIFFGLTAVLAAVIPAARALGAEPLRSLRHE